jgi:hypothetical protein
LRDTTSIAYTFVYEPEPVRQDTVFIKLNTIGDVANYNREVQLIQIPEYTYSYVPNAQDPKIIDTIKTEMPNKAVPGKHYVPFDDPSLKNRMVVQADSVTALIPVILLRDPSLKNETCRLRVQLAASPDFGLGEVKAREITILFSDRLERFYSWRVDNYQASAYNTFGKYSINKHQFMIDILKIRIDEEWYQAVVALGAAQHYKNYLKEELEKFNNDPENIAAGKAPMRETGDPNSPIVFFP